MEQWKQVPGWLRAIIVVGLMLAALVLVDLVQK